MISKTKPTSAEVLLGATLAAPLLANLVPYPFLLVLGLAPVGLGAVVLRHRHAQPLWILANKARSDRIACLLWLLLGFQILGVLQSSNPADPRLVRDLLAGGALATLASVARMMVPDETSALRVLRAFLLTLVPLAAICAILGLAKLFLLERGITLGALQWLYPTEYPWGSSLKRDYNFFALSILIGMLALTELWFHTNGPVSRIAWSVMLGIMAVAGAYAGSRRFWIIAPAVLLGQIALLSWRGRGDLSLSRRLLVLLVVGGLSGAGATKLIDIAADIDLAAISQTIQEITGTDVGKGPDQLDAPGGRQPPTAGGDFRSRASTLASSSESFGIASRWDRWKYAIELVDVRTFLIGSGFDYHRDFSCRFLDCEGIDYPHSAVLSSLLYGGVGAFFVAVGFVGTIVIRAVGLIRRGGAAATAGTALAAALPFYMISGDTFSSLPGLVTLAILASILAASQCSDRMDERAAASARAAREVKAGSL